VSASVRPSRPIAAMLPTVGLLAAVTVALAYDAPLPGPEKLLLSVVALAAVALGAALRLSRTGAVRDLAPVPVLVGLGALAAQTPVAIVPDLLGGVAGVAVVLWLLDDPLRPAQGISRAVLVWGAPAAAVGVAWASATLLPTNAAPVGVAGGLLVAALAIVAYLIRRPQLFDREAPTTI
jgi:hypothetical protein